jgi:hypothetical protein
MCEIKGKSSPSIRIFYLEGSLAESPFLWLVIITKIYKIETWVYKRRLRFS